MHRLRALCALIAVLLTPLVGCNSATTVERAVIISKSGARSPELSIEIADNDGKRQLGLMYRREMEKTHGMLFVFPEEAPRTFWMKNTYLELDMLFFDSKGVLVAQVERATPLSESRRESKVPAKYVLETLGGMSREWGVELGSRLSLLSGPLAAELK